MGLMNPKPEAFTCRTCEHNVLQTYTVAGKKVEDRACTKSIVSFPKMINCRDWQRAVGTDDE